MRRINALVRANLAWTPVCVGLVIAFWSSITPFGVAHLLGEGVYVGGLADLMGQGGFEAPLGDDATYSLGVNLDV